MLQGGTDKELTLGEIAAKEKEEKKAKAEKEAAAGNPGEKKSKKEPELTVEELAEKKEAEKLAKTELEKKKKEKKWLKEAEALAEEFTLVETFVSLHDVDGELWKGIVVSETAAGIAMKIKEPVKFFDLVRWFPMFRIHHIDL